MWWAPHQGIGWWMIFGGIWMILFWGVIIGLIVWGIRALTDRRGQNADYGSPERIAELRYARGEINREQLEEIKATLSKR
jgi:putative membrane protein